MKKRALMHTRRALAYQLWIFTQQPLERSHVTSEDCFHGRFEYRHRGVCASQPFNVLGKLGPALEGVLAGNNELRIGKSDLGVKNFCAGEFTEPRMVFLDSLNGFKIA